MDQAEILLSICIPTFKRGGILVKTLDSIYSQIDESDRDKIEVIVTDNDPEHENELYVYDFKKYSNFHYHKNLSVGFLNSLEALRAGRGALLKLHNVQMAFKKNSVTNILRTIELNKVDKPQLFFSNGVLNLNLVKKEEKFDNFMNTLSYRCSWSAGFALWSNDRDVLHLKLPSDNFPQTCLLFNLHTKKDFLIDDHKHTSMQFVKNKGGYNIFKVFGCEFLDLLDGYLGQGLIKRDTFEKIKADLAAEFFPNIIFKNIIFRFEKFCTKNFVRYLARHYSKIAIFKICLSSLLIGKKFVRFKL